MARTYNPFAAVERSKVETPWGVFEVAPPNKARLAAIQALQTEAESVASNDLEKSVELGMRTAATGVENGDALLEALQSAWHAGEITVGQITDLATFIGEEISGEANKGND